MNSADNSAALQAKFWKALKSDPTIMIGLDGVDQGHTRPMTAQLDGEHGPIWFFTSTDNALVRGLATQTQAIAAFASKGHDLFASVRGRLSVDNDRAVIDHLWNGYIAAWYEGGKDDPKLALLRLDADHAEIWLNASTLLAGVKILLGLDPTQDFKGKVADVPLA